MRKGRVHRSAALFLLFVSAVLGVTAARADVANLPASKDNTLYEDRNGGLSNGAGDYFFAGFTQSRKVRRGLIAFDLTSIPAGSTVNSVTLTLHMSRTTALDQPISLHRVLADWGEGSSDATLEEGGGASSTSGDATWLHTFYPGSFWSVEGGDFVATASATLTVGATITFYAWSSDGMKADVQGWVDSPSTNYGWMLIGNELERRTTKRFDSRTNPDSNARPVLTVDYTPIGGPATGGCCTVSGCQILTSTDCAAQGGTYQGDDTTCTPDPCGPGTGACCADLGTCTDDTTQTTCEAGGGTYQGDGTTCGALECPVILTAFVDPLPIPPLANPVTGAPGAIATYDISMRETQQSFHSDLPLTTVWGYDDGTLGPLYPGPTILASTGAPITVNWLNDLRDISTGNLRTDHYLPVDTDCIHGAESTAKTVVHLHGGHVEETSDGYPESTWTPGFGETYFYPNQQQAATLWYHDHALGVTRLNVMMGLAGLYVVTDPVEQALNLPAGEFDVPLAIQDRTFRPDGSLSYPATWQDHWVGDTIVVNGKAWPYLDVKQGKYRFRILNGSTSRFYTLMLDGPGGTVDFTVIGTEGGLLEAPVPNVSTLTIGPGERYDLVVDFAGFLPGDAIFLQNTAPPQFPNGVNDVADVMKFNVLGIAGDTDPLPATLRAIERLQEVDSVQTRDFRLKKGGPDLCGRSPWLINDLKWNDITEYPELDTVEIWRFINDSGVTHPMHMHLVFFQVLDRDTFTVGPGDEIIPDGNPVAPSPEEDGWKDTALVGPGEILRVIARFEDYKGKYAYHCHILEHEDHEMMRQFQTVRCGDAELDPTEACDDGAKQPGDGCSAGCDLEEFLELSGIAVGGGSVTVDVGDGTGAEVIVPITVPTGPGDTPAEVAAALAAAINANVTLQSLGITAVAIGNRLVVNGVIENVTIGDAGLQERLALDVAQSLLWWSSLAGAASYDIVEGGVLSLSASLGDFSLATQSCTQSGVAGTQVVLPAAVPGLGDGLWFLVRSAGGSYDTGAASQVASRDAGVAASGNDCP